MILYLLKGYVDMAATSLADAKLLLAALDDPADKTNAYAISRIMGKIEQLVQGDSSEPITLSSIDDTTGTISSWVTDSAVTVSLGLGDPGASNAALYASTASLSISGSTRVGTLALNTIPLRAAVSGVYGNPPRKLSWPFTLQVQGATVGLTETKAMISLRVRAGVVSGTPVDLTATSYITTADALSAFQPSDADLTAIAALTTTTFGRSLLTQADAAAARATQELAYPTASLAVAGNIAVWANSMGTTGSSTPWPYWLAMRTGRPVYNGSIAGETSTQIKARFDAATDKRGYFTIFDVGRNDSDFTVTKSNIAAMIASLGHTRYLVIGVLCRQSTPTGNAQHTLDLALNAELQALYGPRFYDPQAYLVGMWDPNVSQDVTDHSNDVFPSSLEYANDSTHLNLAGHLVQADRITPQVLHLGALPPAFVVDASITKAAPTLSLINTGGGGGAFALATTSAAGQFRITESGVADRLVISKTTGNVGIGTITPLSPFVISNNNAAGIEFAPASGSILGYDRTNSYSPLSLSASTLTLNIGSTPKLSISSGGHATFAGNLAVSGSTSFSDDATISKSAPTLTLANSGAGGAAYAISTTAAAGQFRITESGVADRLVIDKTTGNVGVGTVSPIGLFNISNGGAAGLEIDPRVSGGTQINILGYNRGAGAYVPIVIAGLSVSVAGGVFNPPQFSSAPTYAKGAMYFDTTLNKLRIGGAAAWETVTSI